MKQQAMMTLVPEKLRQIERKYGIRILYAVESGSRAWGTHSPHSDFDVRFIYIRPREEYLRLDQTRDVLEFPIADEWDMCGWDLSKLLQLLHGANTQIYEWFSSSVVYVDDGFSQRIRPLMDRFFSVKAGVKHYLNQADRKQKQQDRAESTKVKHYLYRLQHLSSAQWILDHQGPAPVNFETVTRSLPERLQQEAKSLLERKRSGEKLMPHDLWLDAWLLEERQRLQLLEDQLPRFEDKGWEELNRFFLSELERL